MALAHRPARLIVLATSQSIPLYVPPMTVGRRDSLISDPDIVLDHRTVSRRHAIIDKKECYTVQDLQSLNKTRLNGIILTPKQEYALHDGDILEFGDVKVRFEH
ncbi:MAG: FHA domain-containing protein [Chloroflexi bacterium]|nr:FHA domain-containing protein [Chloroflexota bacterium]